MLERKTRYFQIAFNSDISLVGRLLPLIPQNQRIFIEAGTPYIKKEGINGISAIRRIWPYHIVADLKIIDGAAKEVEMAALAGATAITAIGSAPAETLNLFIKTCKEFNVISMIDMIGTAEPLKILLNIKKPPDVVILHKGRDEETVRSKTIPYKQVNKIRSKYDLLISAAGGIGLKEARSAIFNGANIVIANIVSPEDPWAGVSSESDITNVCKEFLKTIE